MRLPGQPARHRPPDHDVQKNERAGRLQDRGDAEAAVPKLPRGQGEEGARQPEDRAGCADHRRGVCGEEAEGQAAAELRQRVESEEGQGAEARGEDGAEGQERRHVQRQMRQAAMQEAVGREHQGGLPGIGRLPAMQQTRPEGAVLVGGHAPAGIAPEPDIGAGQHRLGQRRGDDEQPDDGGNRTAGGHQRRCHGQNGTKRGRGCRLSRMKPIRRASASASVSSGAIGVT